MGIEILEMLNLKVLKFSGAFISQNILLGKKKVLIRSMLQIPFGKSTRRFLIRQPFQFDAAVFMLSPAALLYSDIFVFIVCLPTFYKKKTHQFLVSSSLNC